MKRKKENKTQGIFYDLTNKMSPEIEKQVEKEKEFKREVEVKKNENILDELLEELEEDYVGRKLTKTEEDAVLTIVDRYTPTGADGKYIGGFLCPFDYAWEVYLAQQEENLKQIKKEWSKNKIKK